MQRPACNIKGDGGENSCGVFTRKSKRNKQTNNQNFLLKVKKGNGKYDSFYCADKAPIEGGGR